MTMQSKLVLVGVEHIDGAKSSYTMCAFAQGADVCKFMCKDTAVEKLPLYKHYDVTLQYGIQARADGGGIPRAADGGLTAKTVKIFFRLGVDGRHKLW